MKKNTAALLLALIMLLGCLSACGKSEAAPEVTAEPTPEVTETPAPTEEPALEDLPELETPNKYDIAAEAYPADKLVMTINGEAVTWGDYYYWLYTLASQMEYYYAPGSWSDLITADLCYGDYVRLCVDDMLCQYWVVGQEVKKAGIELNEDDLAAIKEINDSDMANYGGGTREGLEEYLKKMHITPELYDRMNEVSRYYNRYFEEHFGAKAEKLSDEDTLAWANENGYMRCKHILISNKDAEGAELTVEEMENAKTQADELLRQLKTAANNEELEQFFDELMTLHSSDPGAQYYTDGYYFTDGEMVAEFENASKALEEYGLSEVVESSHGYHIILRLPLEADGVVEYGGADLRYMAAAALYDNITGEWFKAADVKYESEFEALDLDVLFAG